MRWAKRGRIFHVGGQLPWMAHHATLPVPHLLDDDRLRIYFGPRDADGRTRTAFREVDPADPARVLNIHEEPALGLGELGAFDDNGAMPCCVVDAGTEKYLYYLGWTLGRTVPYHV